MMEYFPAEAGPKRKGREYYAGLPPALRLLVSSLPARERAAAWGRLRTAMAEGQQLNAERAAAQASPQELRAAA